MVRRFDAVLFDLLTALLDSGSLWSKVAGNPDDGTRWRAAYLRSTYAAGRYRPYQELVADTAEEVGLPRRLADDLASCYAALEPWPEAPGVLKGLGAAVPLGIVTNCSEKLGRVAAARTGGAFGVVVTAERAGFYKPDPRPYRVALDALRVAPERCLFVAGSAYDLFGTGALGLPTYWHDRVGMAPPPGAPAPQWRERTLTPLLDVLGLAPPRASR
jgi:2-haloalkanoic acid dehalogenase type II